LCFILSIGYNANEFVTILRNTSVCGSTDVGNRAIIEERHARFLLAGDVSYCESDIPGIGGEGHGEKASDVRDASIAERGLVL